MVFRFQIRLYLACFVSIVSNSTTILKPVLRIRIPDWNADPDPAFYLGADPDPDPDPGNTCKKLDYNLINILYEGKMSYK